MDQKVDWRIERTLEALLFVFLAAAAFGLMGRPSPAVKTLTGSGLQMRVEYKPVSRLGLSEELQLELPASSHVQGDDIEVQLNNDYLKGFDLARITPQPQSESVRGSSLVLVFDAPEDGTGFQATIELASRKAGLHKGRLQASIGSSQVVAANFATRILP